LLEHRTANAMPMLFVQLAEVSRKQSHQVIVLEAALSG
jgi:hypothetical protein